MDQMDIQDTFNYAMARWAVDGEVDKTLFDQVVALSIKETNHSNDANYLQCLSVAHWAAGDNEAARTAAEKALTEAEMERVIFSCWRYRDVPYRIFRTDMREISFLIDGDVERIPQFMHRD